MLRRRQFLSVSSPAVQTQLCDPEPSEAACPWVPVHLPRDGACSTSCPAHTTACPIGAEGRPLALPPATRLHAGPGPVGRLLGAWGSSKGQAFCGCQPLGQYGKKPPHSTLRDASLRSLRHQSKAESLQKACSTWFCVCSHCNGSQLSLQAK